MHKLRKSKGFTLIELMVVVAIIGILAAVAVPKFLAFLSRARKSEARTTLTGIYNAEEAYMAEYEWYGGTGAADTFTLWRIGFSPAGAIDIFNTIGGTTQLTCAPGSGTSCPPASATYDSGISGGATPEGTGPHGFTYAMSGNIDTDSYEDLWIVTELRRAPCNLNDDLLDATTVGGDFDDSDCNGSNF